MASAKNKIHAKVLMVGPDLSLHGGIVSVVKGYLDAGLPEACDAFEYLGTGIGSSKLGKSVAFTRALIHYAMIMPSYDIIHLHISARGSYKRKSIMARMARKAGKYVILHDHDGEFKKAFEEGGDSYRRDVRRTFSIADRVVVLSATTFQKTFATWRRLTLFITVSKSQISRAHLVRVKTSYF